MTSGAAPKRILDLSKHNEQLAPISDGMKNRIVGQDEALEKIITILETHKAGLNAPGRPVGNLLFLGPTGSGKTRVVESLAEVMFGDPRACLKVDCAEFQHSHEIAKLIGSPPGYLGHRETPPLLTQEAINKWHTPACSLSILLFDEIEKASDALWQLLLGVLDKATLTLGDNRRVDLSQCLIIMTSNLGGKDMQRMFAENQFGFRPKVADIEGIIDEAKNSDIANSAARKHFTPEFMNRVDHTVVFHTLTKAHIRAVMQIELGTLQRTMFDKAKFVYQVTDEAKDKIMSEGYSTEYGARFLKRTLDRRLRVPLARLVSSGQIAPGDAVVIDEVGAEQFEFSVQKLTQTRITFKDAGDVL